MKSDGGQAICSCGKVVHRDSAELSRHHYMHFHRDYIDGCKICELNKDKSDEMLKAREEGE